MKYSKPKFKQMIYDHKKHLIVTSKAFKISNMLKDIYKYRDVLFVKEELKLPKEYIWIVKYINDIPQDQSLVSKDILLIPDINHIKELYDKYQRMKSS